MKLFSRPSRSIAIFAVLLFAAGCSKSPDAPRGSRSNISPSGTRAGSTTTPGTAPTTPGSAPRKNLNDGYNLAVATPETIDVSNSSRFGDQVALAIGKDGQPVVAYTWLDMNGDGTTDDTGVFVTSWDTRTGEWTEPAQVVVAPLQRNSSGETMALAISDENGDIAIVFENQTPDGTSDGISIAWSVDEAKSFTISAVSTGSDTNPSVTLTNGRTHVVYSSGEGVKVASASRPATDMTWEIDSPPAREGATIANWKPSLAVNSDGDVAVAYVTGNVEGSNKVVNLWFVGTDESTVVMDSNSIANDSGSVALAFRRTNPSIAAALARTDNDPNSLYIATSNDAGATFGPSVAIPPDGSDGRPFGISFAASDRFGAIMYASSENGESSKCGKPKLAVSTDLAKWTTCSPDARKADGIDPNIYPQVAIEASGRVYELFANSSTGENSVVPRGVLLWTRQSG